MGFADKAKGLLGQAKEQVEKIADKAPAHGDTARKAAAKAKDVVDDLADDRRKP